MNSLVTGQELTVIFGFPSVSRMGLLLESVTGVVGVGSAGVSLTSGMEGGLLKRVSISWAES